MRDDCAPRRGAVSAPPVEMRRLCTFFSPSPIWTRTAPASSCCRNAGSYRGSRFDVEDRREAILTRRKAGEHEPAVGRRPGRPDPHGVGNPVPRVGRVHDDGVVGRRLSALVRDRAGELGLAIGERDDRSRDVLTRLDLRREVERVLPVDGRCFEEPARLPPPDPVSRYLPGSTPAMVNRPFASTRPDADDENARATPDETSIGERFTRTRLKSAGGCWVVPSNSTRPATVMPGCSVSTTFERLRPSTDTVVIAQKRSGSARGTGARGCAVFGGGGPGGGFCIPCAMSVYWPGATFERRKRPSAAARVLFESTPGSEPAALTMETWMFCRGCPVGLTTSPSTRATGTR